MTTALYDRRTRTLGADTQDTTSDGSILRVHKIWQLKNGWYFLGSGHMHSIVVARQWAERKWDEDWEPTWELFLTDPTEYGFACLVIDPKRDIVWFIDNELSPDEIMDEVAGVGTGAAWGVAALESGATMMEALERAAKHDPNSSAPFEVIELDG